MTIQKIDFYKIVDCLDEFSTICEKRGVKFGVYSPAELMQILTWYKNYKLSGEPPF